MVATHLDVRTRELVLASQAVERIFAGEMVDRSKYDLDEVRHFDRRVHLVYRLGRQESFIIFDCEFEGSLEVRTVTVCLQYMHPRTVACTYIFSGSQSISRLGDSPFKFVTEPPRPISAL